MSPPGSANSPARFRWWWLWMLCAALVAAALRGWNLPAQILTGDEWHAIQGNQISGYWAIWGWARILGATLGLSELGLRLPLVVCGVVSVVALPCLLRRHIGTAASCLLAGLLAIAPFHVLYSRHLRPYALVGDLALLAVLLAQAWWRRPTRRRLLAYLGCVFAIGCLQYVALPFALAPIPWFLARRWRAEPGGPSKSQLWRQALAAGVTTAVALSPLLVRSELNRFLGRDFPDFIWFAETFRIFAGTSSDPVCYLLLAFCLVGLLRLSGRHPRWTAGLLCAATLQLGFVLASAPYGSSDPVILGRYLIPLLPLQLICLAVGLSCALRRLLRALRWRPARAALRVLAWAALLAALVWQGPLPATLERPNSWVAEQLMLRMQRRLQQYARSVAPLSPVYRHFAAQPPGSLTVVETPFAVTRNALPFYQAAHRQHNLIGLLDGLIPESSMTGRLPPCYRDNALRNFVQLARPDEVRAAGADYIVMHWNLRAEQEWRAPDVVERRYAAVYGRLPVVYEHLQTHFGAPVYSDSQLVVFAVAKP